MNSLHIALAGEDQGYRPGDSLESEARWQLDEMPDRLEVRVFWYTEGKGDEDVGVVDSFVLANSQSGSERFQFWLPEGPYSFSGKLITLHWGIELIAEPQHEAQLVNFVLSPTGRELRLGPPGPNGDM